MSALLFRLVAICLLCFPAFESFAQTEQQCLNSFDVKDGRNVSYIAVNSSGALKAPVTMSCKDAELFRERLYVSMDKGIYDSESVLRSRLASSRQKLASLASVLKSDIDKIKMKAAISAATAVVYTPSAIASTVACASAVVDGVGVMACGPAVKSSLTATVAWTALLSSMGDAAEIRAKALVEIDSLQSSIDQTNSQLDAAKAKNARDNYSTLFVSICRAVKEQCL